MLWFIWREPSVNRTACLSYCAKARGMGGHCVHTLCVRFMYVKLDMLVSESGGFLS